jgi:DNA-binding response OmpR family regulator
MGVKKPVQRTLQADGTASDLFEIQRTVLVACPGEPLELRQILAEIGCTVHEAGNCRQVLLFLCRDRVPAIVAEAVFPDGNWRDILSYIAPLPCPPRLIVTSRIVESGLWAEVLNMGGYDVLAQPFTREEVRRVVYAAQRSWGDERQRSALRYRVAG